ncbi:CHAT domain-containing tetratricopeptide repeat protein [Nostoc sp. UHCC 0870]|uniref:CHAT domain-containing tetratricopeptide repeat protein n=1 Tax=Nostoc sp. UHCC 0870 TaxID=2914041 RepID=UPI001EDD85E8|nr:CHAT domain-containing tetratricopeptide repeat protein [Nostoc sp. UHCC 0870]UKP00426.1 CHAT domain-containing protein [Nostoc sp. UHCC 0870]
MNEQRLQAYYQLIEKLLDCPSGEEPEILAANTELLDADFVQVLTAVADNFAQQGEENRANWLRNLATYLTTPETPPITEADIEIYRQFILEVLRATAESNGNPQVIYPLLAANTHKLDRIFAELLRRWATTTLAEAEPDTATSIANVICNFSNLISDFPLGSKANNMEIAITGYEITLTVYTRTTFPVDWAMTQNNLAIAYSDKILGNRGENLENAIAAYSAALEVRTRTDFPVDWATTQNNLGNAYLYRILGNRGENLENAIAAYSAALEVYTRTDFPEKWATTQNNLAAAYGDRILGNRGENLENAIAAYSAALEVYTRTDFPEKWATTQNNLAAAYGDRILGNRGENLENAIAAYSAALEVYTRTDFPVDWAMTQNNLGNAYLYRILGNRGENLENAIAAYSAALEVRTRTDFPVDWATTQNNLGNAYLYRILGNRGENLENAIAAYSAALEVRTRTDFPVDWATTQNNLGNAYLYRILGNRGENLENAIAAYSAALEVYTRTDFPVDWAMTQNNLGNAYLYKILGNRGENLENAIAAYSAALEVRTRTDFPVDWATTQNNLGNAYSDKILGNRGENLENAIAAYSAALEVRTRTDFPEKWATTQNNLAIAYSDKILGNRGENLENAIAAYSAALEVRTRTDFPEKWATTQNNLAIAYSDKILGNRGENLENAIAAYSAALEVRTRTDFPVDWATTQNNLAAAYLYRILGNRGENLENAIAAYSAALEVRTRTDFPVDWATTQNNLGNAYLYRILGNRGENLENAIAAYSAALEVRTRTDFPEKWATTQNNLAAAYGDRILGNRGENLENAIAAYSAALEVYTRTDFPEKWATTQNNLAAAYGDRILGNRGENLENAIAAFSAALEVRTRTDFPQNNAETLLNLGILYQEAERFDLAYNTFTQAIETVETLRGESNSGEEGKRKQAAEWNQLYRRMVEVCLASGRDTAALEYIERSKTRNLVELILNSDLKTIFPPELATQLEEINDKIAISQYQLQNSKVENPTALAQDIQQWRQQRQALQDSHLPVGSGFKFDQFQNTLADNTAIIEWYIVTDKILTFIIKPNGQKLISWQSQPTELDALYNWNNEYLEDYYNPEDPNKSQWQNQLETRLKNLAEILHIEEILAQIPEECKRLILIPHLFLHLLPLHALPVKSSYLIDLFPNGVSYAPSCQILQQVQLRQCPDFQSLFAIQNPTPDLYQDYEKDLGAVTAIKKNFAHTDILKQDQAKKSAIINIDENHHVRLNPELLKANCIFFFCHGYFDPNSPQDSGLQLADDNLTLTDIITHFKLTNCRLVTLSACETGVTDSTSTSDEYIGLPSGFLLAGSTNVVSSQWTVSATATALLMIKFYEELQQQSNIVLALNTAQRWLRDTTIKGFQDWLSNSSLSIAWQVELDKYFTQIAKDQGESTKPFKSPFYWAAFYITGKGV